MDAKEIFSAGIRIIGLLVAGRGFADLIYFFLIFSGVGAVSVSSELPYFELYYGLFYFFIGLYFLRGAPLVIEFAFPNKETEPEDETETEQEVRNEDENP